MKRETSRFLLPAVACAALLGAALRAPAFPIFARKYQTSCQTCHTIFPKLNPFGEAFRLNGYHLPGETEEQVKQKPVSLGADAYARLWPKAVYPSSLPGDAPVALNIKMADVYASSHDDTGRVLVQNDFQFPQEVNLFTAGTLGDHFSFMGELTYAENADGSGSVEIEHARLDAISVFGPEHLVNFRIGKFAPNLYDGFQEMWLMTDNGVDSLFNYNPIGWNGGTGTSDGGGGVGLPARTRAIEMYGVAAHRLFYTVGLSSPIGPGGPNGAYNNTVAKDFYARVDYKLGGMALDGDSTGVTLPPENWRETSVRFGAYGYWGDNSGAEFDISDPDGNPYRMRQGHFSRVGGFASVYIGDVNLIGSAVHGSDDLSLRDAGTDAEISATTRTWDSWFAQADWVIVPAFQASLRYENLRVADASVDTIQTLNANLSFLVRANIKLMVEYRRDLHDPLNYQVATVLRAAF